MRRRWLQGAVTAVILALGGLLALYLLHTRPELKRRRPAPHPPLVEAVTVQPRAYRVVEEEFGTVRPVRTGEVVPEVAGRVVELSPSLVVGGRFRKGEVLVRLDPRDYEAALAQARGDLAEAERALAEVESEAESSLKEWREILGRREAPPPLVAREPQLAAARARVEAARARLRKARLDLERTVIRAPFDGLVVEESVELGQFVSPGEVLARIYDARAVEVAVPLELKRLAWLLVPGFNAQEGSPATVLLPDLSASWTGRVVRAASRADEKTRLLTVFVRVADPFSSRPPLLPGFFVRVRLTGRLLEGVFVLPRRALRRRGERFFVHLVDGEGRLAEREVSVVFLSREEAVVDRGLAPGERVVVSRLAAPVPGMAVRVKDAPSEDRAR